MKKRIFRITILIIILAVVIGLNRGVEPQVLGSTVRAVGDLEVDWGVAEGAPIFVINNMAPGQTEIRQVVIVNNAATVRPVSIRGVKTAEMGNLSTVLDFIISENGTNIYEKTLDQFITESSGVNGILFFSLNPGATKTIAFKVTFKNSADNQFQNTNVVFDLIIGIVAEIPSECQNIKFSGEPIFGTAGNDRLRGTNGNDLIIGLEGNDMIDGDNGDDCLIGGPGNDNLKGTNGNDEIYGGDGNDKLDGGNGDDVLIGGNGNDVANGGLGKDKCDSEKKTKCEL